MDIDLQALVETFLAESAEGLQAMEQALVDLEARPEDREAIGVIFRVMHTIKGNAGSLGYDGPGEFAHQVEDVLALVRSGELRPDTRLIELLLESVDILRELLPAAARGEGELGPAHRDFLARLEKARAGGAAAPAPASPTSPSWRGERRGPGRRLEDAERESTLRVDRTKLDRMLDLTGEIAIAEGRLRQVLSELGPGASIAKDVHGDLERRFGDLQELVMQARMVPLGPVFRRFVRTVRDVSQAHGKLAQLVIEGEDVEVDTSVVEHIRDPLTHLVRNAIDHGLETPEARRRAGKDPCGRLCLRASQQAGSIVIEVSDDGGGLDCARIAEHARSLGLLEEAAHPSEHELQRLIFEPGFSTAETVSDLSGRGVGLDVVRRNIEVLRGSVEVRSQLGRGTTITLRLPLTLAIIAGLNVGVDAEVFVVPLESVVECVELWRDHCSEDGGRGVINLRGESLPYVRVREALGVGGVPPRRERVVVVQDAAGRAGLAVDVVHGESQAVIKPLGRLFRDLPGVSGVTILGDGRVALILDVTSLLRRERERSNRMAPSAPAAGGLPAGETAETESMGERPC